jgi:hypothetical protein
MDPDARAYEMRQEGLTYRVIAKWLGVTLAMARRRVYGMNGHCPRPGNRWINHKDLGSDSACAERPAEAD